MLVASIITDLSSIFRSRTQWISPWFPWHCQVSVWLTYPYTREFDYWWRGVWVLIAYSSAVRPCVWHHLDIQNIKYCLHFAPKGSHCYSCVSDNIVHNWNTSHLHYEYCNVLIEWVETHKCFVHSVVVKAEQWTVRLTYLAQRIPWSIRRFLQVETQALHFAELKLAISPNVGDSGAQFLVGGDCVRASPVLVWNKQNMILRVVSTHLHKCIHTNTHTHTHMGIPPKCTAIVTPAFQAYTDAMSKQRRENMGIE